MAKKEKAHCPHRCPLCALYEAQEGLQRGIKQCIPSEVSEHVNQAGHELLLAVQALCDKGLWTAASESRPGPRRKAQRITVE
ncbi:MAG: hypothetical protein C3F12_11630 [Candidatus Methylomirabilota bacterium]|nr:hypothetical protein [Candidatus Methylomirabilis sp.]NJD67119.1 hypothetical protein [candidate division NC10 bacterium]PWB43889.1 MAG: hypothetical protein C3F12_11630 [candidate division NC10 bacterium]